MRPPADVLAVMRDAEAEQAFMARSGKHECTVSFDPAQLARMREARAAVAELIEAARVVAFNVELTDPEAYYHEVNWREMDALVAALARVKGDRT